jgi:hypothetical protein
MASSTRWHRSVSLAIALQLCASSALAQASTSQVPTEDARRCSALTSLELQTLRDAPTRVVTARLVDVPPPPGSASPRSGAALLAASAIKQYCQVTGYVAPQNKFELRLPIPSQWNEKLFFVPCAGFCGGVNGNVCNNSLSRGYASVTNNGGHDGAPGFDGTWGANAPNLQEDFAWRSSHVVTLAAKAITTGYYGRPIKRSYISGCSKGGHAVLMELQRFPQDYDGAIVAAPVYNWIGQMIGSATFASAVHDGSGKFLLDSSTVGAIHQSVLARCGSQSGVAEPFVSEPLSCDWRADMLACSASKGPMCLTPAQVAAVSKVMRPAADSRGRALYSPQLPGAESDWGGWFYSRDSARSIRTIAHFGASQQFSSFMAHPTARDVDPLKLTIDQMAAALSSARALYDATNPDLSAFKGRGGKVLMWHGLSDGAVPAGASINYYDRVAAHFGGRQTIDGFFRLFLVPGVHHCAGGPGPDNVDTIAAIENWVERGVAPSELIARRFVQGVEERSRPVYPYPTVARYSGSGDPLSASSFVPKDTPSGTR